MASSRHCTASLEAKSTVNSALREVYTMVTGGHQRWTFPLHRLPTSMSSSSSCVWHAQPKVVGQLVLFDCARQVDCICRNRADKPKVAISHPINVFKAAVRRAPSLRELNSVGKFNRGKEPKAQNMIKPRQLLPMTQDTFSSEMQWLQGWHKGDACEKSHAAVWSPVSEGKLSVHPHPAGRLWRGETGAVWSHYNMSQSLLPCDIISPACASPFNQPGSCFR